MTIQLNQDERDYLEQFVRRKMKPTRRQKAIALLRLAEGDSPEQAAQHAGIPKEDVTALANGFDDSRLAGVGLRGKPKRRVRLVRPGVGVQEYYLLNGVTLADLLRQSRTTREGQVIYVDGVPADDSAPLHDGAIVMIVPQAVEAAANEPWRRTVPSFQDDELFEEFRRILKSRRRRRALAEESDE